MHRSLVATALGTLLTLCACGLRGRPQPAPDPAAVARVRSEVEARLAAEPSLRGGTLRVEVQGGTVLLHGNVQGIGAWQCAITNAELVRGVTSVADYLVIERGPRDVRCLAPRADRAVAGRAGGA